MTSTRTPSASFLAAIAPYRRELARTAQRLTRSASDADDLLQDTLLRAYAAWPRFEHGSNVRAWLHRILRNGFIDRVRRRRAESQALSMFGAESRGSVESNATTRLDSERLSPALTDALAAIPREFRDVVLLVGLRELTYEEAARTLGCPVGTVMSRLHRGRRSLRERLGDEALAHGLLVSAA